MDHWRARSRAVIVGFGRRVRERRLDAGISQDALGHRSHMRKKAIGEIERGQSNPSLESMALIACGLGCNVADLLAPPSAKPYVLVRAQDMQRAQEAVDTLRSVLRTRNRVGRSISQE